MERHVTPEETEISRKVGGNRNQALQGMTTVSSSSSGRDITLTWSDTSVREAGFIIERQKVGTSAWTEMWRTEPNATQAVFPDTTEGSAYSYRFKPMHWNPALD
ncbi:MULTISPECIES: fibronectin type III domain-containing protein [Paenibacillus]|uniref:Uncharacterized protein n=1 Tax=Paenibacillus cineris TaxID=237530 RepID=A0ABQ4LCT7_9BACL|nr:MULTISPECIES: fibronectin type III domain-containing protein [Paenibacillus]GIO54371.1 hypothetical protein J21TS7_26890 [Paenibacillus cineris]